MSTPNIGAGAGAVLGATSGISNLANSLAARLGGSAASYSAQLRQASFRGVPFVVLGGESSFGRRTQVHEYPLRDDPWVEDIGRGTRQILITAFLIGDDVIQQRDTLIAACETEGPGTLIHPTLGQRDVSLGEFHSIEQWEKGRYFELQFAFIQGGPRLFPSTAPATGAQTSAASALSGIAAAADFAKKALTTVAYGAAVLGTAVGTALSWYTTAKNVVGDARNLFQLIFSLPGDFGRFAGSATVPTFSQFPSPINNDATTQTLIDAATVARADVALAGANLGTAAASLDASTIGAFTDAANGVATAVLAATPDPSDSIRLLSELADFSPAPVAAVSPIGVAMATMQSACADLFRRLAVGAVAQASSVYQPTSSDDAARVRDLVTDLIDSEIEVAGDQGEDDTYDAMRTLRAAVVADLNTRGAALAGIKTFVMPGSLPALTLANQIYRDASRADDLLAQADPIHPAFMPLTFTALAS